ncbi:hypothetical protein B296_00002511 [Ensete ventricosum]|uniref:Uncharacterized protein n=1 Tax=Ensete ventricosum TaxID=4639 RepID=A0A426Y6L8_ENSVE|nr:hypothetical protein B296_00002511 [Ensete ventricosum]
MNTQLQARLVHCHAPHEWLQQFASKFTLATHLRLLGVRVQLAPSCLIHHDVSPWYDRSSWRVGLLQCSHSLKRARQVRGQGRNCWEDTVVSKQVVERGEKATTSPVGLSNPKVKRRLARRWTKRSTTVPQRRDFRGVIGPLLSWRESIGRKRGRGGGECKGKLQVPRQGERAGAKELHKIGVDGLIIKIVESEGLWVDAGVLDQGTK